MTAQCTTAALGLLLIVLAAPMAAHACTSVRPDQEASLVVNAWDDTQPDMLVAGWQTVGAVSFLSGCSFDAAVPIDATAAMPGLRYVRSVILDGQSYPAFELQSHRRSPLLIFRHSAGSAMGSPPDLVQPLDIRTGVQVRGIVFPGSSRWSWVSVAAVSRGGDMEAVPLTTIGTVTHASPDYPHLARTDTFRFTANLRTKTCALADKDVSLRDINPGDLPAAGSTAAAQSFNVVMTCNAEFPVDLMLTDATQPANTGSRLLPTTKATAQGVRVELLREGVPVVLGQTWKLPQSATGAQDIPMAARYYREAGAYSPGVVEGQAILTATYR